MCAYVCDSENKKKKLFWSRKTIQQRNRIPPVLAVSEAGLQQRKNGSQTCV
jgi:hypothetical protein